MMNKFFKNQKIFTKNFSTKILKNNKVNFEAVDFLDYMQNSGTSVKTKEAASSLKQEIVEQLEKLVPDLEKGKAAFEDVEFDGALKYLDIILNNKNFIIKTGK